MNKNNYYYKKLIQSIIFSEYHWTEIVDPTDPHDNIYTEEFLSALYLTVTHYQKKACLEKADINKLQTLLSDLRFTYPYHSRTEKEELISHMNEMIRISNQITSEGKNEFYMEEYQKRYGIYAKTPIGKYLLVRYWAYYIDEDPRRIKDDLAQDIYPLMLLFHEVKDLTENHLHTFLLTDYLLSTINALESEQKAILQEPEIRNRFLYLLRKNRNLLETGNYQSSGNDNDDFLFKVQNHMVLRRLERM